MLNEKEQNNLDENQDKSNEELEVNQDEIETKEAKIDESSIDSLKEEIVKMETQTQEYMEKTLRVMADLDNMRKRSERDVTNAHKFGLENFAIALLPIVDSLEHALQVKEDKKENVLITEGVQLTLKMFLDVLEKHGVTVIDPLGQEFNPHEHEAMSMQEDEKASPGTVLNVFQKGYKLNDRVIRPARVIVAKASGEK